MLFEVWRLQDHPGSSGMPYANYRIRILYNGRPLNVTWCDMEACLLSRFLEHVANIIPSTTHGICKV